MTRGRKKRPLIERIASKIRGRPNVAEALRDYTHDNIPEHWIWKGVSLPTCIVHDNGTTKTVVRALLEFACDEPLHYSWSTRRNCGVPHCVNPSHHTLVRYHTKRHDTPMPLPLKLWHLMPTDKERDADELASIIASSEPRPTPEEFKRRSAEIGIEYSDEEIAAAYALLEQETRARKCESSRLSSFKKAME